MKNYFEELKNVFPVTGIISISAIIAFISCSIDYFRPLNKFFSTFPQILRVFLIAIIIVIILCILVHMHIWDLFKMPCANVGDSLLWILLLVSLMYLAITCLIFKTFSVERILAIVFSVLWILLIVYRLIITNRESHSKKSESNIFDLKKIYEGNINVEKNLPILISEKDVDYDLLNRTALINQLIKTIYSCPNDSSYVVGLQGEWGSGKTTIINNVKRVISEKEDIIVVKDFDPWLFGTQESLLEGMYDIILESTGIKYSSLQSKNMLKSIGSIVASGFFDGRIFRQELSNRTNSYREVKNIKNKLSMFLRKTNKTVVLFIDNIDRAEADNIIFLFKLVGTLFDLPGIVYVLSYDRERINTIFSDTEKINPKYLEKIIQLELGVPSIQQESLERIYERCISNVLSEYGISPECIQEYKEVFNLICEKVLDLRKFKRLINSTFPITFIENKILNQKDLLTLEIIRFLEPELYFEIRNNQEFFVSHDPMSNIDIYRAHIDKKKFNDGGKEYFDNLIGRYGDYLNVLADLFPYVRRYLHKQPLISDYSAGDSEYAFISKTASVCSAKYFDLYFSYGNNDYTSIKDTVEITIEEMKNVQDNRQLNNIINIVFASIPKEEHREWLEQFQFYIDELPSKITCDVAKILFENIYNVSSAYATFALNAQSRVEVIIELLLEKSSLKDVQKFEQKLMNQYNKLAIISDIIYWFENVQSRENIEDVDKKEQIVREAYALMCREVIECQINLYEDPYYHRGNIWGLLRYYKDDSEKDIVFERYMSVCLSRETIYRILGDAVTLAVGHEFQYSITENSLADMYITEDNVDLLLPQHVPETESEEFVLKVYEKYKTKEKDLFDRCSILSPNEVELKL